VSYVDPIYDIQIQFASVQAGKTVTMRAAITDFSDSFSQNWDAENAYGRQDPLYAFSNTQRSISLGWQLAAKNSQEAQKHLKQIASLIRMMYPSYDAVSGNTLAISGPPLMVVRFSNLIRNSGPDGTGALPDGLVCTMDSFSNTPLLEAGFYIEGGNLFPKMIDLSCAINPIHTHELGWVKGGKGGFDNIPFPYGQSSVSIDSQAASVPSKTGGPTENDDTPGTDVVGPVQEDVANNQAIEDTNPANVQKGMPTSAGGVPSAPMSNKELDEDAAQQVAPEVTEADQQAKKQQDLKAGKDVIDPQGAAQAEAKKAARHAALKASKKKK